MDVYTIMLKPSAVTDMDALRKYDATHIADAMERHLQQNPTKEGKSRIKRLRGISNPDYRLRVGDYRIFYVVDEIAHRVHVLRVMHKNQTLEYYKELQR
jgi:mRNA interferase RelE/StbE